jgi:hypothetical protein
VSASPWRGSALAAGLTAAALTGLSWPTIRAPTRWLIGPSHNDAHGILWGLDHTARALAAGRLPALHTTRVLFPEGGPLRVANLAEAILVAPVTLTLGAIVAFNLLTLLHHCLGAAAGYWCGKKLGASSGGAALVSIACGFAPQLCATTFNQNPDVSSWFWVPLTAGLAWRASGLKPLLGAALCASAAALSNPYGGVMAAVALICLAPWERRTLPALWVLGGGLGLAWWLFGVPAGLAGSATAKVARDNLVHGIATPLDLLQPWPNILHQDSTWDGALVADFSYLGISLILFGLWGMRRRPAGRWWLLLAASLLLALGPALPAYAALEALTPLGRLHLSHRFTYLAVLVLAIGAARALGPRQAWLAAAVVAVDLIGTSGPPMFRPAAPFQDGACALLQDLPEGAVFDLPGERGEQWLWAAACHGRPVAAGLNRAMPPGLEAELRAAPKGARRKVLRDAGFRYIVRHGRSRRRELGGWAELVNHAQRCRVAENRQGVWVIDLDLCVD